MVGFSVGELFCCIETGTAHRAGVVHVDVDVENIVGGVVTAAKPIPGRQKHQSRKEGWLPVVVVDSSNEIVENTW